MAKRRNNKKVEKQRENPRPAIVNELYAPYRVNFPRKRIEIKGLEDLLEIDIADFQNLKSKNKNFAYCLLAVNPFSKKIYTRKLKTKSGPEVAKAFEEILNETGLNFKLIFSDSGKEFFNQHFEKVLGKFNLKHYSTKSKIKASHAERYIRTLKNNLYKEMDLNATQNWIDLLEPVTNRINSTPHSRLKFIPNDVTKKNAPDIQKKFFDVARPLSKQSKFRVGNKVRISEIPLVFRRGFHPHWSPALYTVKQINYKLPQTYRLTDHKGRPLERSYYAEEMQKTKYPNAWLIEKVLERKRGRCKCRWYGLGPEDDSWIWCKDVFAPEK